MADVLYHDETLRQQLRKHYTPDIRPNWYGGHLLEAWYLMRDQGLFWPWYEQNRKGALRKEPHVDPVMIQQRVFELFRSEGMWRHAYQAHFSYPLARRLSQSKVPLVFAAPSWDPQYEASQAAARDFPRAPFVELPDEPSRWARTLLPLLNGER
jgi:hypothetical protein